MSLSDTPVNGGGECKGLFQPHIPNGSTHQPRSRRPKSEATKKALEIFERTEAKKKQDVPAFSFTASVWLNSAWLYFIDLMVAQSKMA